jgi:Tol biopolymer transport system component
MMPTDRFERQLPQLLNELAEPRTPDYLDDLLWQTAHTSQRPAWSLLERWLPVFEITRQPVMAPRIPWRSIGLTVLLVALTLALVASLIVGSRPRVPAPFGPARSGLVAYAADGDIYTVDPATGSSTAIVTGPETDLDPRWSLDGRRLAFERSLDGRPNGTSIVVVVNADGSDIAPITPDPLTGVEDYGFSPDGQEVLISATLQGVQTILIAAADGTRIRQLDIGRPPTNAAWRPIDGAEILFMERGDHFNGFGGLFVADVTTGGVRTIFERAFDRYRATPMWSSNGAQIAYTEWVDSNELTAQTHIVGADGTGDRVLPLPPGAIWQAALAWSNDGTRLLVIRGYTGGYEESVAAIVPVDASDFGIEVDSATILNQECCSTWEWAPDDSSILGTPTDVTGTPLDQVLVDPVTGATSTLPWSAVSPPSWQRLAP